MLNMRIATVSINETDLDLVRRIESAHILTKTDGEGYDPEGRALPLSREEARGLLDSHGDASVVVEIDLEKFAHGMCGDSARGEHDIYDVLHEAAFGDFGVPTSCEFQVLGVASKGDSLIVRYTTRLYAFFAGEDEG